MLSQIEWYHNDFLLHVMNASICIENGKQSNTVQILQIRNHKHIMTVISCNLNVGDLRQTLLSHTSKP